MSIIIPDARRVNLADILTLRVYDRAGQWHCAATFTGGAKVTGPLSAGEVAALEGNLSDQGWSLKPSLFSNGFSARPPLPIPFDGSVPDEDEELIFAEPQLWPDDYAIPEPQL